MLSLVGEDGRVDDGSRRPTLNAVGDRPRAPTSPTRDDVEGREIEGGREIQVEESWAEANGIDVGRHASSWRRRAG